MDAKRYPVELSSKDLEVIEMGLNHLLSISGEEEEETTVKQIRDAAKVIDDAALAVDASFDPIDADRLSAPSDIEAWSALVTRAQNNRADRVMNSQRLQKAVDIHRPTTTEKGHN